ncbi:hypothetical protein K402DRAFT_370323 [Aulographum hederae CBS 113979]|uniref:Tyrosine specific protein phosphatases domain-containing protein n=1 Tax=Aulographum hederae CBS 113979 TaxID=1176131 RepID=A0A6G1HBG9_9PEZI|nr:hypothetical protein K402DRAFT_370323 [Aulographum hederae CBS 113979]
MARRSFKYACADLRAGLLGLQLTAVILFLASVVGACGTVSEPARAYNFTLTRHLALLAKTNLERLNLYPRTRSTVWSMVTAASIVALVPCLWLAKKKKQKPRPTSSSDTSADVSDTVGLDAAATDPGLLKKHSTFNAYSVASTGFTYPSLRTFYRPHPQADKLPTKPAPLPLLVLVHGLGGSVAQFHPLLISLVNIAPSLSIDLPGCGLSNFEPKSWEAYTTQALVALLETAIEEHRDIENGQGVVLIGHSMGSSLCALLAASSSISRHVLGVIAICPVAEPQSEENTAKIKKLLKIPGPIFNLWRMWDRRGGEESGSVYRFAGKGSEQETRRLQVRFNEQSKTPVFRRMASGALPDYSSGRAVGGMPGEETWSKLDIPLFLVAGESDQVTPASEIEKIAKFLGKAIAAPSETMDSPEPLSDSSAPVDSGTISSSLDLSERSPTKSDTGSEEQSKRFDSATLSSDTSTPEEDAIQPSTEKTRRRVLKTTVLPAPAAHALLYAPSSSRILAGLIQTFLSSYIDERLSLGWQLQYLTTEGKWDVKNLAKWKAVAPVSKPIAGAFRALKTLREVDEVHRPSIFVQEWKGKIGAVIDISHESPVYDPQGLEKGGIRYYKFPTVSKLPPTVDEVKSFIDLVDRLRDELAQGGSGEAEKSGERLKPLVGVHCHYGYNRTGFFIVCYLVERLGFKLRDAIEEFGKQRPPGIRHDHFVDTLYVRYCVGLKRAPTL